MDSNNAIEQGFIPYPYTFPAIRFTVEQQILCPDCEDPVDPDFRKCTRCNVLFSDYAQD